MPWFVVSERAKLHACEAAAAAAAAAAETCRRTLYADSIDHITHAHLSLALAARGGYACSGLRCCTLTIRLRWRQQLATMTGQLPSRLTL
jgi:hypothetical protein